MVTKRTFTVIDAAKDISRARCRQLAGASHHVVGLARGPDPDFFGTSARIDHEDGSVSAEIFADSVRRCTSTAA